MNALLSAEESTSSGVIGVDPQQVRDQLERLLESPLFRQSRRYAPLLRFIVDESLEGRGDLLKERLLGVHVFGRDPSYDTAADPIVRVTVAEIRRRMAQFYYDPAHSDELRIELPPGHYAAKFCGWRENASTPQPERVQLRPYLATAAPAARPPSTDSELGIAATAAPPRSKMPVWVRVLIVSALVAAGFSVVSFVQRMHRRSALDEVWGPLLRPERQVLICLPTDVGRHRGALTTPGDLSANDPGPVPQEDPTKVTFLEHEATGENVVFSDALSAMKVANLMVLRSHEFRVRLNVNTTLDDLRQGPAVLIGGLDNQWSLQAIAPLRYGFKGSDEEGYWISDAQHPRDRRWSLNLKQTYAKVTRDFALIARIHSRQAGQAQMVIAGIGMSGTVAASEMLVDPHRADELVRRLGKSALDKDFEVILSTDVINGVAGAPQIQEVWTR